MTRNLLGRHCTSHFGFDNRHFINKNVVHYVSYRNGICKRDNWSDAGVKTELTPLVSVCQSISLIWIKVLMVVSFECEYVFGLERLLNLVANFNLHFFWDDDKPIFKINPFLQDDNKHCQSCNICCRNSDDISIWCENKSPSRSTQPHLKSLCRLYFFDFPTGWFYIALIFRNRCLKLMMIFIETFKTIA